MYHDKYTWTNALCQTALFGLWIDISCELSILDYGVQALKLTSIEVGWKMLLTWYTGMIYEMQIIKQAVIECRGRGDQPYTLADHLS